MGLAAFGEEAVEKGLFLCLEKPVSLTRTAMRTSGAGLSGQMQSQVCLPCSGDKVASVRDPEWQERWR